MVVMWRSSARYPVLGSLVLALSVLVAMTAGPAVGQDATVFQRALIDDQPDFDGDGEPDVRADLTGDGIEDNVFKTYPVELEDIEPPPTCPPLSDEECPPELPGRPDVDPIGASMTAELTGISVTPDAGLLGGDVLEFNVDIANTSTNPNAILTAFAFQSKHSESPALGSRIGDKLLFATAVPGSANGPLESVKKNGTSNGLFTGKWKGICVNSSTDYPPEFNGGNQDESLECAGSRADADNDGEPELVFDPSPIGLAPGDSQTIRLRLDTGTTDGALHRVPEGTLTGTVEDRGEGFPAMDETGNVLEILDFVDNKVLRDAAGNFDPSFAPASEGFSVSGNEYLTLPRPNHAFTDLLGRNHTCGDYGLDALSFGRCAANAGGSPELGLLDDGDLVDGVENFAAILQGFGEYIGSGTEGDPYGLPSQPYGALCENCAGRPYTPIAEFLVNNGDGTATQEIAAGSYGALGSTDQYTATIDPLAHADAPFKQSVLPEEPGGGPPPRDPFGATANAEFTDLDVEPGAGSNGGDAIEFSVEITNTSDDPDTYLTALNYQTKKRGLADIGVLDGTSQDRRDILLDSTLDPCTSWADGACWNQALGVGHFPNVIGNGLLFGQMVAPNAIQRGGEEVDGDQLHVDPEDGIEPTEFWLESVKKNGPFTPILQGNHNFICIKSGLFVVDPDADAACAGEPAILDNPDELPTPANVTQRLGLPPGETQTVRMRMDFGDFRGVMLRIAPGTLTPVADPDFGLKRTFDCSDQRELEYCHPDVVGDPIGYLDGSTAEWLTPATLEQVEHVILNQPGTAPTKMNFVENFGQILTMAGFLPSAEFYKPDTNPDLVGSGYENTLIREQVLGIYDPVFRPTVITSAPVTEVALGEQYEYQVVGMGDPNPVEITLEDGPEGMTLSESNLLEWTASDYGEYPVKLRASNGEDPDGTQSFEVTVPRPPADDPKGDRACERAKRKLAKAKRKLERAKDRLAEAKDHRKLAKKKVKRAKQKVKKAKREKRKACR